MLFGAILVTVLQLSKQTCVDNDVDCKYQYSEWSECDPCKRFQSRAVQITESRHGRGAACPPVDSSENFQQCVPSTACPEITCDQNTFRCQTTGRCIGQNLVCNGEDDCGDYTDEKNCSADQVKQNEGFVNDCVKLTSLPFVNLPSAGYDIITETFVNNVLDNSFFGGTCQKIYDPDSGASYRLPANFGSAQFQVKTTGDTTTQTYDSYHAYRSSAISSSNEEFSTEASSQHDFVQTSKEAKSSQSTAHNKIYNSMKQGQSLLYEVSSTVEVAQFHIRDSGLMLNPAFRQAIYRLPDDYNAKAYHDFIKAFGTHYIQVGTLGGRTKNYHIFNKTSLADSGVHSEGLKTCLSTEASSRMFGNKVDPTSVYNTHCKAQGSTISNSNYASSMASETISDNAGGTSAAAYVVPAGSGDVEEYKKWLTSVKSNPAILTKKMGIICGLISEAELPEDQTKKLKANCETALSSHLQRFSSSGCRSCLNGGIAMKVNETCICTCPDGTVGDRCQMLKNKYVGIKETNPFPVSNLTTESEQGITSLRVKYDRIYAMRETGEIRVYRNDPFSGLLNEAVVGEAKLGNNSFTPSGGFDVDSEETIWTFDKTTGNLIRLSTDGQLLSNIPKENISNYCFQPKDVLTTCDDDLIVLDECNKGRFFVLSQNGTNVEVQQYDDGQMMPEPPSYGTLGGDGRLYITSFNYVTIFEKSSASGPYQYRTSFEHGVQFPGQTFVDHSGSVFLSCSYSSTGGYSTFLTVFRPDDTSDDDKKYKAASHVKTSDWEGGCVGLAGSGSEVFATCREKGLVMFRTI